MGLLLALSSPGACGSAAPDEPPEHARAYLACRGLMRRELEEWRQQQRRDLTPEEFQMQVRFAERESEDVSITTLEPGLYVVDLWAEYPSDRFSKGPNRQRFVCRLRESWSKAGFTTWL